MDGTTLVARVALAVPEQRADLELSQRQLARLAGVSASTIRKLERGGRVDPALVVRLAGVLNVLELTAPPRPEPAGAVVFDLERELEAWARAARQGGAA